MDTLKEIIMDSFSFGEMGNEEKEKMINELADIAVQRTTLRAVEMMSQEQAEEFNKVCSGDANPKDVFAYLERAVPSYYDMLREEVVRLQTVAREN